MLLLLLLLRSMTTLRLPDNHHLVRVAAIIIILNTTPKWFLNGWNKCFLLLLFLWLIPPAVLPVVRVCHFNLVAVVLVIIIIMVAAAVILTTVGSSIPTSVVDLAMTLVGVLRNGIFPLISPYKRILKGSLFYCCWH
jgi:hypothetical protein